MNVHSEHACGRMRLCTGVLLTSSRSRVLVSVLILIVATAGACLWFAWRMGYSLDFRPPLRVDQVLSGVDGNRNGTDDSLDIVAGARKQIELRPIYRSAYYDGGYPPDSEGVCTDVLWRAFLDAGYDWKRAVDGDIAAATGSYPRIHGTTPDPNIDFRRVPNLYAFLSRKATELTAEVRPWDRDNLKEWQPGDLVIFGPGNDHIGIVSDKRRRDGVPLVIHHGWATPVEDNILEYWGDRITAHFRVDLSSLER